MEKLIVASQNRKKIKELNAILSKHGYEPVARDDAGLPTFEIVEDGTTFEENSYKKAYEIMKVSGKVTIGDDSGLMIDALGGEPGIYSSRYAGEDCDDMNNNLKVLEKLKGVPYEERTAKFVTVITMCYPDGKTIVARGECKGHIALDFMGEGGFGYDPIFVPEGYENSFAQLGTDFKNTISHRARALEILDKKLNEEKI
ncbi:MAG: RdgB/HAM1 family non-canonical purine NTP pyrophosphatase [Clostridia bacterium]|nr:RdgB/HAM1 family non-canonical purine NTP pyrophosphatase [Clostridia bacterium]